MTVWAISDLHLSLARPDRRERFGGRWADHVTKLEAEWRAVVRRDDLVLLPGDVSMARNHRDLQPDLRWLDALPGLKVLAPGNHDGWWNDLAKVRSMLRPSLRAEEGTAETFGDVIVAGARSIEVPREEGAEAPAVERALAGLDAALDAATALRAGSDRPLILLWHFSPFDAHGRPGVWVDRFERAGVTHCLFGHLHTQRQWSSAPQGLKGGVRYQCVAADAVGFRPLRILES